MTLLVKLSSQAIYEICKNNLSVDRPTYTNLNRIVAQVRIFVVILILMIIIIDSVISDSLSQV